MKPIVIAKIQPNLGPVTHRPSIKILDLRHTARILYEIFATFIKSYYVLRWFIA